MLPALASLLAAALIAGKQRARSSREDAPANRPRPEFGRAKAGPSHGIIRARYPYPPPDVCIRTYICTCISTSIRTYMQAPDPCRAISVRVTGENLDPGPRTPSRKTPTPASATPYISRGTDPSSHPPASWWISSQLLHHLRAIAHQATHTSFLDCRRSKARAVTSIGRQPETRH